MEMCFHKYHGTGNDFILVDDRGGLFPAGPGEAQPLIARLCARRTGIGADGLILIRKGGVSAPDTAFRMIYYNADGLEGSFCGNGSRCALAFAHELGITGGDDILFEASDGLHRASILSHSTAGDYRVRVQLRDSPVPEQLEEDTYLADTGSPHLVLFHDDVKSVDVPVLGRRIRQAERWKPGGVNVNFVEVLDASLLYIRTYERGVEAETLSCGTGAAAAALAAWLRAGAGGDRAAYSSGKSGVKGDQGAHATVAKGSGEQQNAYPNGVEEPGEQGTASRIRAEGPVEQRSAYRIRAEGPVEHRSAYHNREEGPGKQRTAYRIRAAGGELGLSFTVPSGAGEPLREIMLEGPATKVFSGIYSPG